MIVPRDEIEEVIGRMVSISHIFRPTSMLLFYLFDDYRLTCDEGGQKHLI